MRKLDINIKWQQIRCYFYVFMVIYFYKMEKIKRNILINGE